MGKPKALLPLGPETMLQRVVRLVSECVPAENIVVVAAQAQHLPQLPPAVEVTHDRHPERGPLEGLRAGLVALQDRADAAFVTGCDVPLLVPAFVERMFELLGENLVAAVREEQRFHPLSAVYRLDVMPMVEELLSNGERSLQALLQKSSTKAVAPDELRGVDPRLDSLWSLNRQEDYAAALERAGIEGGLSDGSW